MSFAEAWRRVQAAPLDPAALVELADAALDGQREDEVVALVDAGASRWRTDARLWQWSALLHRAMDERDVALAAFDQAARAAPHDRSVAHGHARTALEAGLPAIDLYHAAQQLAPADGDVRLGLAAAMVAEGEGAAAIGGLDDLLSQNPGWLAGHQDLAQMRWMAGDRDGYVASYERALLAQPRQPQLWLALIATLGKTRQFDRALATIGRAEAMGVDRRSLDLHEAAMRTELADIAGADRLFDGLRGVRDATLSLYRIRHGLRTGRLEPVLAEIEGWIDTPQAEGVWPYAAVAWRMAGDPRWAWLEDAQGLVRVIDLGARFEAIGDLAGCLRALHRQAGEQFGQSVRGGTQTNGVLFARLEPEIRKLRALVVDTVSAHVAALPAADRRHPTLRAPRGRSPRFSGSWSVRLGGSGYHSYHVHTEGWLSSALYVALPDRDTANPQAGWLTLGGAPADLGLDLPPARMVEPKPGRLVLFPSTMWHGTTPFIQGERMTVAFDIQMPLPVDA